jgi:hypothetical protein
VLAIDQLPNARIEVVENAAHALFVNHPEQFERLVKRFLAMASAQSLVVPLAGHRKLLRFRFCNIQTGLRFCA